MHTTTSVEKYKLQLHKLWNWTQTIRFSTSGWSRESMSSMEGTSIEPVLKPKSWRKRMYTSWTKCAVGFFRSWMGNIVRKKNLCSITFVYNTCMVNCFMSRVSLMNWSISLGGNMASSILFLFSGSYTARWYQCWQKSRWDQCWQKNGIEALCGQ